MSSASYREQPNPEPPHPEPPHPEPPHPEPPYSSRARVGLALAAGALFGAGLGVSGMAQPKKVLAFLDVGGDWDATLLFVMGGAVGVHFWAYRWARRRSAPRLDERFFVPKGTPVDARLALGAVLFGIGWGVGGYCPGPAIVSLATLGLPVLVFVATMLVGMLVMRVASPSSE